MDDADAADKHTASHLAAALSRRASTLPPAGICYGCSAVVEGARKFCDAECRDDWEVYEKRRRINGRDD